MWRACEGQQKSHVAPLVDSVDELELLENILESSKPPLKAGCPDHYLLDTPFRYMERTAGGSRFVREGADGAMYAAEHPETSLRESSHWLYHHFIRRSEGLRDKSLSWKRLLFSFEVDGEAIDLSAPPYDQDGDAWMHPADYARCQRMGSEARQAGIPMIRYRSVRDPAHRHAVVLLSGRCICGKKPSSAQDFTVFVGGGEVSWRSPDAEYRFQM